MQNNFYSIEKSKDPHEKTLVTIGRKKSTKRLDLEESFVSKQKTIDEVITDNNINNGNNNGGTPCLNSPKCLAHVARTQRNIRQSEMKIVC